MTVRIALPKVTVDTFKQVTKSVLNFETMDVNKDVLKQYIADIEENNPEIVKYMVRASQMMEMVQMLKMDTSWFALVSMIIMYKALESQYVKVEAIKN